VTKGNTKKRHPPQKLNKIMASKKVKKTLKRQTRPNTRKKTQKASPPRIKKKRLKTPVSKTALIKPEENPIISPRTENKWESWQTFNPSVILLENKIHFLYRALGEDGVSRLGYAASKDGFHIDERLSSPAYEHKFRQRSFNIFSYFSGGGWGGAEDPRIVRVGEENVLYMTYTACGDGELRVGLTSIKTTDFLNKKWKWKPPVMISPPGQVHKNWVLFPEKINGRYAILHSINPEISIAYFDDLEFNNSTYINSHYGGELRKNCWDSWVRGPGPPPVKTKAGWLLFYHALNKKDFGKYKVGAMLLDLKDPGKILYRSKKPVLEPEEHYENGGAKPGVVYMSGALVKDGELLTYYGGSDNYVCVAHANLEEFLESLLKGDSLKLRPKMLKK